MADPSAEVQGLQAHVGFAQGSGEAHHRVVLHHRDVVTPAEGPGNVAGQRVAARQRVLRIADRPAHSAGVGDDPGVRHLAADAFRQRADRDVHGSAQMLLSEFARTADVNHDRPFLEQRAGLCRGDLPQPLQQQNRDNHRGNYQDWQVTFHDPCHSL